MPQSAGPLHRLARSLLAGALLIAIVGCTQAPEPEAPVADPASSPTAPPPPDPVAPEAAPAAALPSALAGTRWQLVAFQSMDEAQGETRPADPTVYVLELGADGTAAMQLDCNRGTGTWTATAAADATTGSIGFGPIAATRMLCPGESLGERLAGDLPNVAGYAFRDGQLALSLKADAGVYLWSPLEANAAAPGATPPGGIEEEVRAALRADLGDLLTAPEDGQPAARFAYAEVDLDGDGTTEVLAYLLGGLTCGSGGCDLKLLRRDGGVLRVAQGFPITQTPVAVGAADASGWRTLWRTEAGGGAARAAVEHAFDGTRYVERARQPERPAEAQVVLDEAVSYDAGLPLQP